MIGLDSRIQKGKDDNKFNEQIMYSNLCQLLHFTCKNN